LLFDCRVLHTMVYCEAVRSAILATAWLLVQCYDTGCLHVALVITCYQCTGCLKD